MATLGVKKVTLTRMDEFMAGSVYEYREEASQTFKRGDFVNLDANEVQIAVDTETGNFGMALQDASGTADTLIQVLVITSDMVFSASQSNAGAAQASAWTQEGLRCSWIKSTVTGETAKTVVDTADTTTPSLEILKLDPRDPVGDTNGRVLFRVLDGFLIARGV